MVAVEDFVRPACPPPRRNTIAARPLRRVGWPHPAAMSIHDYIIDHRDIDWPTVLSEWSWLVPATLTVWIMNRFGDLFIVLADGTVHILDVGCGTLSKVADTRDDFVNK